MIVKHLNPPQHELCSSGVFLSVECVIIRLEMFVQGTHIQVKHDIYLA